MRRGPYGGTNGYSKPLRPWAEGQWVNGLGDQENHASAKTARLRRAFEIARRAVLVVLTAVFSAGLLWAVFIRGRGSSADLSAATSGALALTALLAFAADLAGLFRDCVHYVRQAKPDLVTLTAGFGKVWATLMPLAMTAFIVVNAPPGRPPENSAPWVVIYGRPIDKPPEWAFPVLYKSSARSDWKTGVEFSEQQLDVSFDSLQRIIAGLGACGKEVPVTLRIVGFASSQDFQNMSGPESHLFNVEAANRRALEAYRYLAKGTAGPVELADTDEVATYPGASPVPSIPASSILRPTIRVDVQIWAKNERGYTAMMLARPIMDRPPQFPGVSRAPEELDQRVDCQVLNAGACEPAAPGDTKSQSSADLKVPEAEPFFG